MNSYALLPTGPENQILKNIIECALHPYRDELKKQSSLLENKVPENIVLCTDEMVYLAMFEKLITMIVKGGRNTHINIMARLYHDVLLTQIKSSNTENVKTIFAQLDETDQYITNLGGILDIANFIDKEVSICFTLMNYKEE